MSGQPLWVTLYAHLRDIRVLKKTPDIGGFKMVPKRGLEPPRGFPH